ncbi:MAG: hypothetical protein Barrevirus14_6 [Barrevirus sp.]|uniref:Uncharacterized protein n=1 Tax=Barrevirus sp. TaxID=2487763 RepID=A0A3G4ZQH9_9VIRU|nr:MAG: hypothetical protein Barrevirus14_6 [Barrevirus sp.]
MRKTIDRQIAKLDETNKPFDYTFKEIFIPAFDQNCRMFDLKFEINYFLVHVHIIYKPDYPFSAPIIIFINLISAIKHPLIDHLKSINMCDYSILIDISQQIINCYLIFLEMLESEENSDLVELGEVTYPMMEEEIEYFVREEQESIINYFSSEVEKSKKIEKIEEITILSKAATVAEPNK